MNGKKTLFGLIIQGIVVALPVIGKLVAGEDVSVTELTGAVGAVVTVIGASHKIAKGEPAAIAKVVNQ